MKTTCFSGFASLALVIVLSIQFTPSLAALSSVPSLIQRKDDSIVNQERFKVDYELPVLVKRAGDDIASQHKTLLKTIKDIQKQTGQAFKDTKQFVNAKTNSIQVQSLVSSVMKENEKLSSVIVASQQISEKAEVSRLSQAISSAKSTQKNCIKFKQNIGMLQRMDILFVLKQAGVAEQFESITDLFFIHMNSIRKKLVFMKTRIGDIDESHRNVVSLQIEDDAMRFSAVLSNWEIIFGDILKDHIKDTQDITTLLTDFNAVDVAQVLKSEKEENKKLSMFEKIKLVYNEKALARIEKKEKEEIENKLANSNKSINDVIVKCEKYQKEFAYIATKYTLMTRSAAKAIDIIKSYQLKWSLLNRNAESPGQNSFDEKLSELRESWPKFRELVTDARDSMRMNNVQKVNNAIEKMSFQNGSSHGLAENVI